MDNPIRLLQESIAAESRGMYFMAASKARRAAMLLQESADRLQHEARCLEEIQPTIAFEPLDEDREDHLGEITIDDLPSFLHRQAE